MNDNHKLTFDLKVTPSFNAEDQVLQFETSSHAQVLSREVIRFKEETTRKALIALGWTPPAVVDHEKRISQAIQKPQPEDFGYEAMDGFGEHGAGGWQYEGGEEAYDAALSAWEKANPP